MSRPEDILVAEMLRRLGAEARHARLFKNPRGVYWAGRLIAHDGDTVTLAHAKRVECGFVDGAGDLIGWTGMVITPEMVGRKIAVFTSGEVKTPSAPAARENQFNWRNAVLEAGGRAAIIKSADQALLLVGAP